MAQNAPNCRDTQEVQFKLQDKFVAFRNCGDPRSNVNLLAISSSRGLLFAGNPHAPELKVIIIKDIVAAKSTGRQPLARLVPLPSIANHIACSADGNLLAVNFTQANGTSQLPIYAVQSFLSPEVHIMYNIRLAPEDNVYAHQLLWNPVLPNSLAVVLSNGGLGMYALKDGGNVEMHSLDKSQQVRCGCWSPKGKQLVLGFPSGRLQQFKPDLTPAKTLVCPENIHDGPFDTIAVHWLSTFQFAVVFLQHGEACNPALYIINAPKVGAVTYTNYYDICYSLNGPRNHQFHFTHVTQWNLLLVSSANGVEVGVLGTKETGDTPIWQQLTLLDEARIELPLSEATQDETFPLGFGFDTSSTHQLSINEQQLPSMPMVHVLGTDGTLLAFNFLNLQPGAASVCSPPPPLADISGKFVPLDTLLPHDQPPPPAAEILTASVPPTPTAQVEGPSSGASDISFSITTNTVTSTPAPLKEKPPSLFAGFGNLANKAAPTLGALGVPVSFGSVAAANPLQAPNLGNFAAASTTAPTGTSFFNLPAVSSAASFGNLDKPTTTAPTQQSTMMPAAVGAASAAATAPTSAPVAASVKSNKSNNLPLYTVPPTFTPVAPAAAPKQPPITAKTAEFNAVGEVDDVMEEIINVQISAFNEQIAQQKQQTQSLLSQIESPSTIKSYVKRLSDLQELSDQANDVEFEQDVQGLRHALNEAYLIMAECRGKLEVFKNPDITRLMTSTNFDAAGRRVLSRLQSYVAANEAQLQLLQQQIDAQWEQYQDVLRRNSKSKMNMPCLEGIYQRLTRLQNLVSEKRIMQNNIKAKLKERGLLQPAFINQENSRNRNSEAVDTLADSILSMSLNKVVDTNRAKLSQQKLQSIRKLLQEHKVNIVSPQRPDRVSLKSEVILETKRRGELKKNKAAEAAVNAPVVSAKSPVAHKATQVVVSAPPQLAKPTASKPTAAPIAGVDKSKAMPVSVAASSPAPVSAPFSFSQSSPFVKTTAATVTTTTLSGGEANKPTVSFFGGSSPFSLGGAKPTTPFGALNTAIKTQPTVPATTLFAGFGNTTKEGLKSINTSLELPKQSSTKLLEEKDKKYVPPLVDPPAATGGSAAKASEPAPLSAFAAKSEPATKPFTFSGFGNNLGNTIGGSSSTFNFGGFGSSLGSATAPFSVSTASTTATQAANKPSLFTTTAASTVPSVVTSTTTNTSITSSSNEASAAAAPAASVERVSSGNVTNTTSSAATVTSSTAPAIDNLFGTISICKPQTKESGSAGAPANIFSGFGQNSGSSLPTVSASGFSGKSFFSGVATTASSVDSSSSSSTSTTTKTIPSSDANVTPATIAAPAPVVAAAVISAPATAAVTTAPSATTAAATPPAVTTGATVPALSSGAASTASTSTVPAATTTTTVTPGSQFSFGNAFSNLSVTSGSPSSSLAATSTAPAIASNSSGSIFGASNAFAPASTVSSLFAGIATAAASTTPASGNIFGNIPKPEASVFGSGNTTASPPRGLFASAAAASGTSSPFANPAAAPAVTSAAGVASSGGSIFGQASTIKPSGFGSPPASGGSIFGGATTAVAPSMFGGGSSSGSNSIFGGGNNAPTSTTTAPTSSIFGQSIFSQSPASGGTNLFGSTNLAQPQASGFGGTGSIFGGATNVSSPPASGGSIFGGNTSSGGFGGFSQTTATPGPFGSGFAQGSGSVAQSGFGAPQQQTQSPPGGFGAKPVFGGSPTFGASPTFGGAPTFGSPKGFGTFGANSGVVSPPAFGATSKPPEGNIFETLGGSDTGLSFGNLAQTGNANNQKPTYGGSSFMNYR